MSEEPVVERRSKRIKTRSSNDQQQTKDLNSANAVSESKKDISKPMPKTNTNIETRSRKSTTNEKTLERTNADKLLPKVKKSMEKNTQLNASTESKDNLENRTPQEKRNASDEEEHGKKKRKVATGSEATNYLKQLEFRKSSNGCDTALWLNTPDTKFEVIRLQPQAATGSEARNYLKQLEFRKSTNGCDTALWLNTPDTKCGVIRLQPQAAVCYRSGLTEIFAIIVEGQINLSMNNTTTIYKQFQTFAIPPNTTWWAQNMAAQTSVISYTKVAPKPDFT